MIKIKEGTDEDAILKFVGELISKSKFNTPKLSESINIENIKSKFISESMVGMWWEAFKGAEADAKIAMIYGVFCGTVLAIIILMKFKNIIIGFSNYLKELYVDGPVEEKINKELFSGQTKDEPAYAIYSGLVQYVEYIIKGNANALIICGPPGMSKTYALRRTFYFNKLKPIRDYVIEKGSTLGLQSTYDLLYKHRNRILVLDDFDTPLMNADTVNLLKGITDTYGKRIISLPREKNFKHMNKVAQQVLRQKNLNLKVVL